jgi:hypothetical protein
MKCELWAPEKYWLLTDEQKKEFRCGPGRGLLEKLIPDTWWIGWPLVPKLVITPSCSIHDFCYFWGPNSIKWKEISDRGFKNNLIRQVEIAAQGYSRLLFPITRLRLKKAGIYYAFVDRFGGPLFWKERNRTSELSLVECVA